ncbi:hypothetical protein [Corallococcus exiguus]|uniref:hypothetical protein n=1 Tax=Corallococcus exiguus TaxID=83462 RepID=UPI002016275D|nr:hypothetical protein [Corallococcus exiguus]
MQNRLQVASGFDENGVAGLVPGRIVHVFEIVEVEDGEGELAVQEYIERNSRKHNAHSSIYRARRRVNPVTYEELRDVVDMWVEAALKLSEPDLRKMARLTAAQDRRLAAALAPYAIAAE